MRLNNAHNAAFHWGRRGIQRPGHGAPANQPASQHTRGSGDVIGTTPELTLPLTRVALRTAPRRSIRRAPPCRAPRQPAARSVCTQPHRHQHTTFSPACWQRDFLYYFVLHPVHTRLAKRQYQLFVMSRQQKKCSSRQPNWNVSTYRFALRIVCNIQQNGIISNVSPTPVFLFLTQLWAIQYRAEAVAEFITDVARISHSLSLKRRC